MLNMSLVSHSVTLGSNQPPKSTQPGHPSVGRVVAKGWCMMPCGWGVGAEMVRVWWHACHLSTLSRAVIKCYTNLMLTFCFTYLITYLLVPCINQLVSHHCCVCSTRCLTLLLLLLLAAKTLLKQHVAFYAASWQTLSCTAWILLDGEARPE